MNDFERRIEEYRNSIHSCVVCKNNNNCEIQKENNNYDIRCCREQKIDIFDFLEEDTEVEILGFFDPATSCVYLKHKCKIKDCYEFLIKERDRLTEEGIIEKEGSRDFSIILHNENFSVGHRTGYFIIASFISFSDELDFLNYDENDRDKLIKLFHTDKINFYYR